MPLTDETKFREKSELTEKAKSDLTAILQNYVEHLANEELKLTQKNTVNFLNEQIKTKEDNIKIFKKDSRGHFAWLNEINFLKKLRSTAKRNPSEKNSLEFFNQYVANLSKIRNKELEYIASICKDEKSPLLDLVEDYKNYIFKHGKTTEFLKKQNSISGFLNLINRTHVSEKEALEGFKKIKPLIKERRGNSLFWKLIDKILRKKTSFGVTGAKYAKNIHTYFVQSALAREKAEIKEEKKHKKKLEKNERKKGMGLPSV